MNQTNLNRDELTRLILEYLRHEPGTQFENLLQIGIERVIERQLSHLESQEVLEILHEMMNSNIIMPSRDRGNHGWPFFSLTSYGNDVINRIGPPVYDFQGYIRDINARVQNIDDILITYLSESLRSFHSNLYISSMVMLGCASERAIRLLVNSYINAIDGAKNKNNLQSRINNSDISKIYEEFRKSFNSTRVQITNQELVRDIEIQIDGIFNFIRIIRNTIVHPNAMPNITNAMVYANLQQFSYYIEKIYGLMSYYSTNQIHV